MNKLINRFLLSSMVIIAGSIAASAQIDAGSAVRAHIPMSFTVNGKFFPAGSYHISRLTSNVPSSALVFRNREGDSIVINSSPSRVNGAAARNTHLVFDWVDGGYMLSRIAVGGKNTAYELRKTSEQRYAIARNRQRIITVYDTGF